MSFYKIDFTKSFVKQYKRLPKQKQFKFEEKLKSFELNPYDPTLRNHALQGEYVGYRSIDIEFDLRALYYVSGDTLVIFAFIGSHSQLY